MKTKLLILLLIASSIVLTTPVVYGDQITVIKSKWLKNPVYVDGDVTFSNEWSDANKKELTIGTNYGRSPPFYETTIWAKNDADNLYLLYCIKFDYMNYDLSDTAYIYYLLPHEVSGVIFSDKSVTSQLGITTDLCEKMGAVWQNDLDLGGENNVEGMGHFDGVFYWFEIKKPLNSGDGRDWVLPLGEPCGIADSPIDKEEHLCVGLYDTSEGYDLQAFIQLVISAPNNDTVQSVGGTVEKAPILPVLVTLISRIMIYVSILITVIWFKLRRV